MTDAAPAVPQAPLQGRYSAAEDGQILWQENASNPLPGVAVGRLQKGAAMLAPQALADGHAQAQEWLDIHVRSVLEPLFILKQEEGEGALSGVARDIGARLFDHLGVMHRSDLEDLISGLDADMRKALRAKGVRLGPVLVFLPALVKPAAIRMRAMLWAIWNGKALPVAKPADGRVSEVVDAAQVDRHFYRMIGYPVFGPRAIRIDMLDRVVTDIYDTAQQGVFEAKHKYAEWLGCGLEDLHAVLESMGHRKMKADAAAVVAAPDAAVMPEGEAAPVADAPVAEDVATPVALPIVAVDGAALPAAPDSVQAIAPKAAPAVVKFMLKRGKMSDRPAPRNNKPQHKKPERAAAPVQTDTPAKTERPEKLGDKHERFEKFTPKKAYDPNRPNPKREGDAKRHDPRGKGDDERPRKSKFGGDKDRDREARVYTFEGKKDAADDSNNPFAILKNLQK